MRDEKDKFDLGEFLPYLLNQAAEAASLEFQKAYRDRYGMLRTDWRVLFHLGMYGQMTAKEIAERAKMHKTKISRAVARLEARRFLTRDRDEVDRRFEKLALTRAGEAAYRDLREIAQGYDARLASRFSLEDAAKLRHMLSNLASG